MKLLSGLVLGAAMTLGATADARDAVWQGFSIDGEGGAVDCQNCPEDEAIRLGCIQATGQLFIRVLAVLPPQDIAPGATFPLTLSVDGKEQTYPSGVEFSEMFGSLPILELPLDHPILEQLKAGTTLTVSTAKDSATIPLTGSAQAIDIMLSGCGTE